MAYLEKRQSGSSGLLAIFNSPITAIVSVDFDGRITDWNPGAENIFGYSKQEVQGENWTLLSPPDRHGELRKALDKIRRGRTVPEQESQRLHKDGNRFDIDFMIYPLRDEQSQELVGAISMTIDISQRKQTESALHESSSKIEAIVQTVLDGIITIDQYGTINSLNPAAEQIFQYNAYELIGCNVKMLMPNPYQEEHDQYLKNYLTTGTQKVIGIGREVTGLRKDGSTFPMNLAVNRMEVAGETAFVGTVKDISERIEKEEQIKIEIGKTEKANQELQATLKQLQETLGQLVESEKMAALGSLVAGIAHEVNTPIGVGVTASSHLINVTRDFKQNYEEGLVTNSSLKKFITMAEDSSNIISRNLDRAAVLINSFKQVAVDQSNDELRRVELQEYLREITSSFAPELKKHHASVEIDCPAGISLLTYAGSLYQVIINLVMNAAIHAYDDDVGGKIEVRAVKKGDEVEIQVVDFGKGVKEENLHKIFEPFFTTRRNRGGTGLGLHITMNIVTQSLAGKISAQSQIGQGTSFFVTIPLVGTKKENTNLQPV